MTKKERLRVVNSAGESVSWGFVISFFVGLVCLLGILVVLVWGIGTRTIFKKVSQTSLSGQTIEIKSGGGDPYYFTRLARQTAAKVSRGVPKAEEYNHYLENNPMNGRYVSGRFVSESNLPPRANEFVLVVSPRFAAAKNLVFTYLPEVRALVVFDDQRDETWLGIQVLSGTLLAKAYLENKVPVDAPWNDGRVLENYLKFMEFGFDLADHAFGGKLKARVEVASQRFRQPQVDFFDEETLKEIDSSFSRQAADKVHLYKELVYSYGINRAILERNGLRDQALSQALIDWYTKVILKEKGLAN